MTSQTTHNDEFPDSSYPLVLGEEDPSAARRAFRSTTALLDYRAEHQGDLPFLCPLDLARGTHDVYTFRQTRELVIRFAKAHASVLPRRERRAKPIVVGVMGGGGVEYWLHDRALQRL